MTSEDGMGDTPPHPPGGPFYAVQEMRDMEDMCSYLRGQMPSDSLEGQCVAFRAVLWAIGAEICARLESLGASPPAPPETDAEETT